MIFYFIIGLLSFKMVNKSTLKNQFNKAFACCKAESVISLPDNISAICWILSSNVNRFHSEIVVSPTLRFDTL